MTDFVRALENHPIHLIPERSVVTAEMLRDEVGSGPIAACDFHVVDIESGERVPGGFAKDGIVNIDHHAPVAEMERIVSSTNLAIERVNTLGGEHLFGKEEVVIHHTDCDSVLSAAITRGVIPPDPRFGVAAIVADHTGVANPIADVLQGLQGTRDLELSLECLERIVQGDRLPPAAEEALRRRRRERAAAQELVRKRRIKFTEGLAWTRYDRAMDTALLRSPLPDAVLIVVARQNRFGRWIVKLRLGLGAPPGASLHRLGIHEFDPDFGGRWNAGSNRRAGGSTLDLNEYVYQLRIRMPRLWAPVDEP